MRILPQHGGLLDCFVSLQEHFNKRTKGQGIASRHGGGIPLGCNYGFRQEQGGCATEIPNVLSSLILSKFRYSSLPIFPRMMVVKQCTLKLPANTPYGDDANLGRQKVRDAIPSGRILGTRDSIEAFGAREMEKRCAVQSFRFLVVSRRVR